MIVGLLVLAFAAWELWDVRQKATAWLIGKQTERMTALSQFLRSLTRT